MERNTRIIVVDDQQDLCDQLAKLLLRSGKKNESLSLVQQMRARLLGNTSESEDSDAQSDEPSYIVDTAFQGEQAWEMVRKANLAGTPYAVAFIDMRMPPGWDGMRTAKSIREVDKDIEIVIMTAYADHDQKQISDTVGTPEKLLYIKKPFQAEEIYQLALSLTSKWSLESAEKIRRKWLEILLKGICKVKSSSVTENEHAYVSTLKSMIDFASAKGGFMIRREHAGNWTLQACSGLERASAISFMEENSKKLDECTAIRHFEGKYLLPMKKDGFFAILALIEEKTNNDPDWYKLLCLYIMAVVEELSWRENIVVQIARERNEAKFNLSEKLSPILRNIKKSSAQSGSQAETEKLADQAMELLATECKAPTVK